MPGLCWWLDPDVSYYPHNHSVRLALMKLYRWENWGSERLNDQLGSDETGIGAPLPTMTPPSITGPDTLNSGLIFCVKVQGRRAVEEPLDLTKAGSSRATAPRLPAIPRIYLSYWSTWEIPWISIPRWKSIAPRDCKKTHTVYTELGTTFLGYQQCLLHSSKIAPVLCM